MLTWKVEWRSWGTHPNSWPEHGGFVPGVNTIQAIQNAMVLWGPGLIKAWAQLR